MSGPIVVCGLPYEWRSRGLPHAGRPGTRTCGRWSTPAMPARCADNGGAGRSRNGARRAADGSASWMARSAWKCGTTGWSRSAPSLPRQAYLYGGWRHRRMVQGCAYGRAGWIRAAGMRASQRQRVIPDAARKGPACHARYIVCCLPSLRTDRPPGVAARTWYTRAAVPCALRVDPPAQNRLNAPPSMVRP